MDNVNPTTDNATIIMCRRQRRTSGMTSVVMKRPSSSKIYLVLVTMAACIVRQCSGFILPMTSTCHRHHYIGMTHAIQAPPGQQRPMTKQVFAFTNTCSGRSRRQSSGTRHVSNIVRMKLMPTPTVSISNRRNRKRDIIPNLIRRFTVHRTQKQQIQQDRSKSRGKIIRGMCVGLAALVMTLVIRPTLVMAMGASMGGSKTPAVPMQRKDILSLASLFFTLFAGLALLHAAEIAITTLYPWKVREFAEEEEKLGKTGTFKVLNEDITRVLTTILVASTTCSIFATTIFTQLVGSVFGPSGEKYGALALTGLTLFFVELLPKSIGVTNAESVARIMTPPINVISTVVSPLGISLSWLAKKTLTLIGLKDKDTGSSITDSQLRLIVTGAKDSGTIDTGEQEMIQGVLGLQNQRVKEIMRPRVEIVAVPKDMSVASVLGVVRESGYSRIPVYDGEIDNIVGIVLAKNVLDFFVNGVLVDENEIRKIREKIGSIEASSGDGDVDSVVDSDFVDSVSKLYTTGEMPTVQTPKGKENFVKPLTGFELAQRMEKSISEADLIDTCYYIPDSANGWSVLQEMRKRRVHLAIVVDEYGGTEGLVSLEDIVEEVVGEIYDEDDEVEYDFSEDSITLQEDGSFLIRGDADLEDCNTILDLGLKEEEALKEFATLSGFLCMCAGEIPQANDFVMSRGWCFEILTADDKKILQVKVDRLIGHFDDEEDDDDDNNPIRGFLRRRLEEEEDDLDEDAVDEVLERTKRINRETAAEVERMVEASTQKLSKVETLTSELSRETANGEVES